MAGDDAIEAYNNGSGALHVTATELVEGGDDGFRLENYGTDLTIHALSVMAGDDGIEAYNNGSGALSVTISGLITAGDDGIELENYGTDLSINVLTVIAGDEGIEALNKGSGALNVTSTALIQGGDDGFKLENYGTDLSINALSVTAINNGVVAYNHGIGALHVTTTALIQAGEDGINLANYGTELSINVVSITAGADGIAADNNGSGALHVTTTALIQAGNDGINLENYGTDLSINVVSMTAGNDGITAYNNGTGALSVTTTELIQAGDDGINLENYGTDLTISVVSITAGDEGIEAYNNGSGTLNITSTGTVVSGEDGILVENQGTETTVTTTAVTSGNAAISVAHDGSGALNITTNGLISADSDIAIRLNRAELGSFGGTITNNAGWVSGNSTALEMHSGFTFTGDVNTHADISGGNGIAIDASGTTSNFTINQAAGTITGDVLLGAGDIIFNISGGEVIGDIIGLGTGTVNVNAGAGNSLSFYGIENIEDYNIQSGTVIQLGDFSTAGTTTTVAAGASMVFRNAVNGSGAFVAKGNLTFEADGQLNQTGSVTLSSGSTITTDLSGTIVPLGQFSYLNASSIINEGVTFETNSLLYELEVSSDNGLMKVEAGVTDLATLSDDYNVSAFGAAMRSYVQAGAADASVSALANLAPGDVVGFEQLASTLSPSVSGMVSQGSRSIYDENWRAILNQQLQISSNDKDGVWAQAIDTRVGAKSNAGIDGFSGRSQGFIVGVKRQLGEWASGVALSKGNASLTNKRASRDEGDIDSTQLSIYASYQTERWFTHFNASIAQLDYQFDRDNTLSNTAKIDANTAGDLLGFDVSMGFSKVELASFQIQPLLSLRYSHLAVDSYTENGGLGLGITYDNTETLSSNLQLRASMNSFTKGSWKMTPMLNVGWEHEFLNNPETAQASFSGLSYAQRGAASDNNRYNLGLGIEAQYTNGSIIGLRYSAQKSSDSYQYSTVLSYQYRF